MQIRSLQTKTRKEKKLVDKFEDLMVKDSKTGTPRRADKLIQEFIGKKMAKTKKAEE